MWGGAGQDLPSGLSGRLQLRTLPSPQGLDGAPEPPPRPPVGALEAAGRRGLPPPCLPGSHPGPCGSSRAPGNLALSPPDERDRVQKKTFTKWVNSHLARVTCRVGDLYSDLRDGRNLLRLLEVLSGETLVSCGHRGRREPEKQWLRGQAGRHPQREE